MTDWAGYFYACDMPSGETLRVEVRHAGAAAVVSDTTTTQFSPGDIIRIDFALPIVER